MKSVGLVLLLSASFMFAQDNSSAPASPVHSQHKRDVATIQGCVSRSSGDYVLIKQNPEMTYELQATGKIRLRDYLDRVWR